MINKSLSTIERAKKKKEVCIYIYILDQDFFLKKFNLFAILTYIPIIINIFLLGFPIINEIRTF